METSCVSRVATRPHSFVLETFKWNVYHPSHHCLRAKWNHTIWCRQRMYWTKNFIHVMTGCEVEQRRYLASNVNATSCHESATPYLCHAPIHCTRNCYLRATKTKFSEVVYYEDRFVRTLKRMATFASDLPACNILLLLSRTTFENLCIVVVNLGKCHDRRR